jgi:hypothetical protein
MFKMSQQTAHMLLRVPLNVSQFISNTSGGFIHCDVLPSICHAKEITGFKSGDQLGQATTPLHHIKLPSWFCSKILLPLCWNVQVYHHVARSTFAKKQQWFSVHKVPMSLNNMWFNQAINTLHPSFDHETVLPHLDFPFPRSANSWSW